MQQHNRFVTISVDDGHPTDVRVVELLHKYGLQATFYIPARNCERSLLTDSLIRQISRDFEIGSHTFSHVVLKGLPLDHAWQEIIAGKTWLEDLTGRQIISFCYPRGKFDSRVAALVEKAGFWGARTCLFNLNEFPTNPFIWGVSTHACCHGHIIQIRHALLERNFVGAWHFYRRYKGATDWQRHFRIALDHVEKNGGIAHLYLHSWEIDCHGQWRALESTFRDIQQRKSLRTSTNGTLYRLWKERHASNQQN